MRRPFVLPEVLRRFIVALPVFLHVVQQTVLARRLQNVRDVLVRAGRVTVFLVRAVAVVRPGKVSKTGSITADINAYQRPWMVQESVGPVTGSVSQNWVCSRRPPGDSKQQLPELDLDEDELQLTGESAGQDCTPACAPLKSCAALSASRPRARAEKDILNDGNEDEVDFDKIIINSRTKVVSMPREETCSFCTCPRRPIRCPNACLCPAGPSGNNEHPQRHCLCQHMQQRQC